MGATFHSGRQGTSAEKIRQDFITIRKLDISGSVTREAQSGGPINPHLYLILRRVLPCPLTLDSDMWLALAKLTWPEVTVCQLQAEVSCVFALTMRRTHPGQPAGARGRMGCGEELLQLSLDLLRPEAHSQPAESNWDDLTCHQPRHMHGPAQHRGASCPVKPGLHPLTPADLRFQER